jgi:uncharacterized membrane protein
LATSRHVRDTRDPVRGAGSVATEAIGQSPNTGEVSIGVGIALTPLLWITLSRYSRNEPAGLSTALRWILFVVVLGLLGSIAWIDTGGGLLNWVIRVGHLGAFALWVGGATWHKFVVLPTVRARPETKSDISAQARRFRRHLPIVILTLLGTGIYQAVRLLGPSVSGLFDTLAGNIVIFKEIILTGLTGLVLATLRRAGIRTQRPDEVAFECNTRRIG